MLKQPEFYQYTHQPNQQHSTNLQTNIQQEFLRRTIQIKNKNIDQLLKELRDTKELYQQYKNQYFSEEKKLKTKITDLTVKLDIQTAELEKLRQLNIQIKNNLQASLQKEKKLVEVHSNHIKQMSTVMQELEIKNKQLCKQNSLLKQQSDYHQERYSKLEQKNKKHEIELSIYKDEIKNLRQELLLKQNRWQQEKKELIASSIVDEKRKKEKGKINEKLHQLQNKIKYTLNKL